MSSGSVRMEILKTLKDVPDELFHEFRSQLTDPDQEPLIRIADVENKGRVDIVRLLVSRCTEAGALERTIATLKDIGCNDEALKLESRNKPQSKKSSGGTKPVPAPEPFDNQLDNTPKRSQLETLKAEKSQKSPSVPPEPRTAMSAIDIVRKNKTSIVEILSVDRRLILNKVHESKLITYREYLNLKDISKVNVEGHVTELVDRLMGKGDESCQSFLNLLEKDDEIKNTFPRLKSVELSHTQTPTAPVQETCAMDKREDGAPCYKKPKMDEVYPVNSIPRGICLILNNINFEDGRVRKGTDKDAESLAEVFSWLGFTVLMCVDQKETEMSHVLKCFSTLSNISELQKLSLKVWSKRFFDLQQLPKQHGDVFICCFLSHGKKGAVCGINGKELPIKDITRTFKASKDSPLTGKPKVFLIQACQGSKVQCGVIQQDLETDESFSVSVPEEADVLTAVATVEDYVSFRDTVNGSWFIQSLCEQLRQGCSRGDDIHSILQRVNSDVSEKEGKDGPRSKQMPEIHYTLTKKLILSPVNK